MLTVHFHHQWSVLSLNYACAASFCSGLVESKLLSVMLHNQEGVLALQHVQKVGAQADWAELSDERWSSIFSCIRAPECGHDSHGCIADDQESLLNFYNIPRCLSLQNFVAILLQLDKSIQSWLLLWLTCRFGAVYAKSSRQFLQTTQVCLPLCLWVIKRPDRAGLAC